MIPRWPWLRRPLRLVGLYPVWCVRCIAVARRWIVIGWARQENTASLCPACRAMRETKARNDRGPAPDFGASRWRSRVTKAEREALLAPGLWEGE
jgi:hypothetical protein